MIKNKTRNYNVQKKKEEGISIKKITKKLTKQKKIWISVGVGLGVVVIGGILFTQTLTYREIEHKWYLKQEQKRRDKEWGYLDYSGHEVVDALTEEFVSENKELPGTSATDDYLVQRGNVYESTYDNGVFMNEMGELGDLSFLRLTVYSFENTLHDGVDIIMHVYNIESDVVAYAERTLEKILPTGYQQIIDDLNDINYRGGEYFLDDRKITVEFTSEGIVFFFYGKGEIKATEDGGDK